MHRTFARIAGISGAIAVAAGAFGAHALRGRLTPEDLATFETAARYQMYHALALFGVAVLAQGRTCRNLRAAGWLFSVGTVLFAGSLYALALGGARWLGAITPFGGAAFIVGWICLAAAAGASIEA